MSKTLLIIQREFTSRVKKRTFIIMTIIGPVLFGAVMIAPALLASMPTESKTIAILDQSLLLSESEAPETDNELRFIDPSVFDLEKAKALLQSDEALDLLFYIPLSESGDPDFWKDNAVLYGKGDVGLTIQSFAEEWLEKQILEHKLMAENVDPAVVAKARTNVNLKIINSSEGEEMTSATPLKMVVGFISAFMIYLFVFMYATQIMRGVIEEKTTRIVEVLISSVKPFQLMIGKVIGIGAVGVFQFAIWVILSLVIYQVVGATFLDTELDPGKIVETGTDLNGMGFQVMEMFQTINFPLVLACFLFYFIGGYMLYGSLFAAVGAAVDSETDTQQFLTPLVVPLIIALVVSMRVTEDPDSALSFWFSIIPLTSPIVMMIRIPFGVEAWELALSMILLIGGFFFNTWIAGRIYRVGILMYGKKVSYKEILKWIRYRPS